MESKSRGHQVRGEQQSQPGSHAAFEVSFSEPESENDPEANDIAGRLKLLGIAHRKAITVKRIGLRWEA